MVLAIATLCLILVGGIWIVSDVRIAEKRRLLQNVVYRGYQVIAWLLAAWQGIDAGLGAYYTQRARTEIFPLNERDFPAVAAAGEMAIHSVPGMDQLSHKHGTQLLPLPIRSVIPTKVSRRRPARVAHA